MKQYIKNLEILHRQYIMRYGTKQEKMKLFKVIKGGKG